MSKINLHEMFEARMNEHANEHAPHFESMKWESYTLSHDYCMRQARSDFKSGYTAALNDLQPKVEKLLNTLEFYAWIQPTQFPEGYYEPHYSQGQGGHDRFGTRARQAIAEFKHEGER